MSRQSSDLFLLLGEHVGVVVGQIAEQFDAARRHQIAALASVIR
jgi:hypothetical protein